MMKNIFIYPNLRKDSARDILQPVCDQLRRDGVRLMLPKQMRDGRSYTDVSPMDRAHRVDEIARLLSGEEISDAARRNAEELLDAAGQGA